MTDQYHYPPHVLRWWLGFVSLIVISIIVIGVTAAVQAWGLKIFYGMAGLFAAVCAVYALGWLITAVFGQGRVDRFLWRTLP